MTGFINTSNNILIEEWQTDDSRSTLLDIEVDMLADILHAVVHAGAGVSFFTPFSIDEARAFWINKILPQARAGKRRVLVARLDDKIVGTVQLDLDTPPNQPHRAAVEKMLVHPDARRRGIAKALMMALEDVARAEKRTLLTLDTVTGSNAEFLYGSIGYLRVGVIPDYARGSLTPELESTTIMYKQLTATEGTGSM
jgi:GNAT superfamily N-acetyltransferase